MAMDHEAVLNAPAEDRQRIMQEMVEGGGIDALTAWIGQAIGDDTRRRLFSQAQGHLDLRNWQRGSLDDYIQLCRAGIAEYLRQSEALSIDDAEQSAKLKDGANIMSFNLSASLADCWPDDDTPREQRHFSEGYLAAEQCVRWRAELGKPPFSRHLAFWAKGMHLLSLRETDAALEAFEEALAQAQQHARDNSKPDTPTEQADFSLLIDLGYRGIARLIKGDSGGQEDYDAAREAFGAQLAGDDAEARDEAGFGLAQLAKVYQHYVLGLAASA